MKKIFTLELVNKTVLLTPRTTYTRKRIGVEFRGREVLALNILGFGLWIFEKGLM